MVLTLGYCPVPEHGKGASVTSLWRSGVEPTLWSTALVDRIGFAPPESGEVDRDVGVLCRRAELSQLGLSITGPLPGETVCLHGKRRLPNRGQAFSWSRFRRPSQPMPGTLPFFNGECPRKLTTVPRFGENKSIHYSAKLGDRLDRAYLRGLRDLVRDNLSGKVLAFKRIYTIIRVSVSVELRPAGATKVCASRAFFVEAEMIFYQLARWIKRCPIPKGLGWLCLPFYAVALNYCDHWHGKASLWARDK